VTLHIADPLSSEPKNREIDVYFDPASDFEDADRLIVEVKWVSLNDSILVRTTNRVQDHQRIFLVNPISNSVNGTVTTTWNATLIRDEKPHDDGWITVFCFNI
jgi:hypothetical protein